MAAIAALLVVLVLAGGVPGAARAESGTSAFSGITEFAFEAKLSSCPWIDADPPAPTLCEDRYILFFRHKSERQAVYAERFRFHWFPGGTEPIDFAWGFVEDPEGRADAVRLKTAEVHATVPMSDGSDEEIAIAWDMTDAPFQASGHVGPYIVSNLGGDWHQVDRCDTAVTMFTQQWRYAGYVTGSIDGVALADGWPYIGPVFGPDGPVPGPFAGKGVYVEVDATHGPTCE